MVLGAHVVFCVTELDFSLPKIGPKIGFFVFIGKLSHSFFMIMFYDKDLYYLLYSCTNSIFGGDLVLEIWVEMLLTNQIAGFLNQIDL